MCCNWEQLKIVLVDVFGLWDGHYCGCVSRSWWSCWAIDSLKYCVHASHRFSLALYSDCEIYECIQLTIRFHFGSSLKGWQYTVIIPHGIAPWLWWWTDGWLDGYHYTCILILCFIFHCVLFKLLAVFILFLWLDSNSNCSLFLACKTSVHKLYCVEAICIMGSFYVFNGCLFQMHNLQQKTFLYIYFKNAFLFPSNLYHPSVWKVRPLYHKMLRMVCSSSVFQVFHVSSSQWKELLLYKINFILVYMWERSLIGVYCDLKLESHVLIEAGTTLFECLAATVTAFVIYKCWCWYHSTRAYL